MSSGYEQIYRDLIPELAQCDLAESAGRLGMAVLPDGNVGVEFCGRAFRISPTGVEPADGQPVDVNFRSILAYYIVSKGRGEPEHSYLPLSRMTGMIAGQKSHDQGIMVRPLLREFGDDYSKFQFAAGKLGGVLQEAAPDGGQCWDFAVLPRIAIRLVFYQADDEFPADIQIQLDRSAPRFLAFECLAFLTGCFTKSLIMAARSATPVVEQQVRNS
jgi:hypothetical protein